MEKTPKKNSSRLQLVIAVMIIAALFLAELYVMINESNNVVLLVGIAVLILIALYFVVDAIMDCMNEKNIADRELYDDIHRSEKASYMLLKKNLEEISKQVKALNSGNDKKDAGSEELMKAQKAIAKAAMSKTKETQDRLFIELNNLEASLNDSIRGLSEKLSGFQEEIERLADHIARINEEAILTASKNSQEIKMVDAEVSVETPVVDEPAVFEDVEESANELDFGDIDLGELDLDVSSPVESDDDVLSQLLAAEEAPVDNGGKMGQDDIAALIASMTGGDATPAPEPEPMPAPAPTPAPADNGGKMSQDDIAALIASMTN